MLDFLIKMLRYRNIVYTIGITSNSNIIISYWIYDENGILQYNSYKKEDLARIYHEIKRLANEY